MSCLNEIKINKNKNDWIANLFSKDIVDSKKDIKIKKTITGLSADLLYLPKLNKNINEEETTT